MTNLRRTIIGSIQFAIEATNIFERIFWIAFTLLGTSFVCYLLNSQVSSWNSFISSKNSVGLSEIDFPAVTFCSRGASKYSITERLGNLLDPNSKQTKKLILLFRNAYFQSYLGYPVEYFCSKKCISTEGRLCITRYKEKIPYYCGGSGKCLTATEHKSDTEMCGNELDSVHCNNEKCSFNCECTTHGFGDLCVFPFTYYGETYHNCTNIDKPRGLWCATKVDGNGTMERWGYCNDFCSLTPADDLGCSVSIGIVYLKAVSNFYNFYLNETKF